MPRNGSGLYQLPSGINPVVTQTLITSGWANTTLNDVASALTASIARDGQTIPTANLPMGNFRHTGVGEPTARDQYITLGYVQDGKDLRLTSVTGVNSISANLLGLVAPIQIGTLAQLIPAANNTGPVTLNVNGIGAVPVVSTLGNALGTGNLVVGRPYLLSYDGARWIVLTGVDVSAFAQSATSGWDRPTPTGPYPDVTIVNPNTVHIPAGTGRIIRPSTRDVTGVIEVSWVDQDVVLTNIANAWETTLAINSVGAVVQFTSNVQSAWLRQNIILATVGHINGSIQFISNKPAIYGDAAYLAYDLGILFHNTLINGGRLTANAGNPLHLDIKAGQLWVVGGNADATDSPNIIPFPDQINLSFWPVTGNNTVQPITQTVPVANYDPAGAGTVIAIPGGGATSVIHRLYLMAGQFVFVYGQNTYADLDTAANSIAIDDTIYVKPPKLSDATLLAYIIARKDATDLGLSNQARLINAGAAGTSSGFGGGGSISDAPLDGSTYGRNNGAWIKAVDTVQAGSNIQVNAANPNKPIVSMASSNAVAGNGIVLSGSSPNNRLVGSLGNLTWTGTDSFRNKLINGNFDIWQRAVSKPAYANAAQFLADRWVDVSNTETITPSRQLFTVGQTDVPFEPPAYHRQVVVQGGASTGALALTEQRVEGVRQLAGQTCVLTFYAKADANRQISADLYQSFGTGGSTTVGGFCTGNKFNVTTAWQKFTLVVNVPSIAGKTLGAGDYLGVRIWYSAGTDYTGLTNSLPRQSGTFDIAQVQLEPGGIATQFELRSFGLELGLCQRYFEKSYSQEVFAQAITSDGMSQIYTTGLPDLAHNAGTTVYFKFVKRIPPIMLVYSPQTGVQNFARDFVLTTEVPVTFTSADSSFRWNTTGIAAATDLNLGLQWVAEAEI